MTCEAHQLSRHICIRLMTMSRDPPQLTRPTLMIALGVMMDHLEAAGIEIMPRGTVVLRRTAQNPRGVIGADPARAEAGAATQHRQLKLTL